jgi:hypothetical protein
MKMPKHFIRIRQHSTENSKRLQSCTESYNCKQNVIVINDAKIIISSNFVIFDDEQFWFCFFRRFKTPVQNFDFGLSEFEFEIAQFQYQSYLV